MIIGFGCKARTGKDLAAEHLVERYGFRRRAFADSLKEAARVIFGLTDDQLYGDRKELIDDFWGETPRFILQRMGTECMRRGYDQEVWIRSLHRHIKDNFEHRDWVVPDVRFPNEAEAIRGWGGVVYRVDRPGAGASGGMEGHASETSMDGYTRWDGILENTGSIEEFKGKLDTLMEGYGCKPRFLVGQDPSSG